MQSLWKSCDYYFNLFLLAWLAVAVAVVVAAGDDAKKVPSRGSQALSLLIFPIVYSPPLQHSCLTYSNIVHSLSSLHNISHHHHHQYYWTNLSHSSWISLTVSYIYLLLSYSYKFHKTLLKFWLLSVSLILISTYSHSSHKLARLFKRFKPWQKRRKEEGSRALKMDILSEVMPT